MSDMQWKREGRFLVRSDGLRVGRFLNWWTFGPPAGGVCHEHLFETEAEAVAWVDEHVELAGPDGAKEGDRE